MTRYSENPDTETYVKPDSGCVMATKRLGVQSACLSCPFDKCVYEMTARERRTIRPLNTGQGKVIAYK